MAKKVAILGSTGSIGTSALDVISKLGPNYVIWGLSANTNWRALSAQSREHNPQFVSLADSRAVRKLVESAPELTGRVIPPERFHEMAAAEADIVLVAVVGAAGLGASLAAAKAGKRLALANKESLVMAGRLLMETAREHGAEVLPVDSEHSAIFQAMRAGRAGEVRRLLITASGGPFLDLPPEEFDAITVEDALSHPTWSMGKKITVDSATMANKSLEVVEARWLFDVPVERISVLVHPESIVHSLVEFVDGNVMAQLSVPDMRLPIQYALTYPERVEADVRVLDLAAQKQLTFRAVDEKRFPCIGLGFEVAREGGTTGAVFNAANEVAVEAFLGERLGFSGIYPLVRRVLDRHVKRVADSLDDILEADRWARAEAQQCL